MDHAHCRIQELFAEGELLITDYSSVAFDFAFLGKPVIYYQFDEKDVFENHTHIISRGNFSYRNDGLGKVVANEAELLSVIKDLVNSNMEMPKVYLDRLKSTFPYRDSFCCERVFNELRRSGY